MKITNEGSKSGAFVRVERRRAIVAYRKAEQAVQCLQLPTESEENGNQSVHLLWYIPGDVVEPMPATVLGLQYGFPLPPWHEHSRIRDVYFTCYVPLALRLRATLLGIHRLAIVSRYIGLLHRSLLFDMDGIPTNYGRPVRHIDLSHLQLLVSLLCAMSPRFGRCPPKSLPLVLLIRLKLWGSRSFSRLPLSTPHIVMYSVL